MICIFNQLENYKVKDMNFFIDPLINKLLKLWVGIIMYNICRPSGKKKNQFHGILTWKIHDAPGITYFCGM
jgi:hypothetical protein